MTEPDPRYSFDPIERRGVLLGLQPVQLVTFAVAALLAYVAARARGGAAGAAIVFIAVAATAVWRRNGRPASEWLVDGAAWAARRSRGPKLDDLPLRGHPDGRRGRGRPSAGGRRSSVAPPGVQLDDLGSWDGGVPLGVLVDRRHATLAAVVPVKGRSFSLLDPAEQARRLDGWRVALNAVGRPGTAVRRVQWVQRSRPDPGSSMADTAAAADPRTGRAAESYRDLVAGAGAAQVHEVWVAIAVEGRPPARHASAGRSVEVLRRELRLLEGQLRNADLAPSPPLAREQLSSLIRDTYEEHPSPAGCAHPWALAEEEHWACVRAGGLWHSTYWVADWPRVEVGPDFLAPVLICGGRRTLSLVMEPVPPDRSSREVRAARTADAADEQLRSRAGFLPSARRGREAEGVMRREAELADGHAEFRFSGYLTVHATDRVSLETACAEAEHSAQAAQLELRRLYGRQAEALTWTLPLARGLR